MQTTGPGEHSVQWIDPRAGIATDEIKASGGGWMLRYYDEAAGPPGQNGPVNLWLPENTPPSRLAEWASMELGRQVVLTGERRPRRCRPGSGSAASIPASPARR